MSSSVTISTHAPLAGRDERKNTVRTAIRNFNPRAPCGARPSVNRLSNEHTEFQPTRPLRGATGNGKNAEAILQRFQPTRPLRGATNSRHRCFVRTTSFQPTRPLRGATKQSRNASLRIEFQPTRPLRGATNRLAYILFVSRHFNPRAPCGARQQKCTNHYAHFCDNRQISDAFAQNAACQGILLLFDAGKSCGFWVRTAQVISAHLCFAL